MKEGGREVAYRFLVRGKVRKVPFCPLFGDLAPFLILIGSFKSLD